MWRTETEEERESMTGDGSGKRAVKCAPLFSPKSLSTPYGWILGGNNQMKELSVCYGSGILAHQLLVAKALNCSVCQFLWCKYPHCG